MGRITIEPIGYIENDYKEKFGIPRQSGLTENVISKITFTEDYQDPDFFREIEKFTHLWLIWYFSEIDKKEIKATVRPPKLGGNKRVGVFASRSPFRPNRIGISCVKLVQTEFNYKEGKSIFVSGADLMNGTPIIDIKPYLPYTDSKPDASNGFALDDINGLLDVKYSDEILSKIPFDLVDGLLETLKHDPRPSYQNDSERVYGMSFGDLQVKFKVDGNELTIIEIE
ncbi:MAG: tRNA (N6-threonylcarbamoyladenosine(37)-N6)-methyltransferase TrmO [Ruminococcaceae bacterium]|nr:tRNA (N6-threonylcarbamoyladenosine(37)-N6)-methyltransferase TrmO [Oscillospiraceae bacterium]